MKKRHDKSYRQFLAVKDQMDMVLQHAPFVVNVSHEYTKGGVSELGDIVIYTVGLNNQGLPDVALLLGNNPRISKADPARYAGVQSASVLSLYKQAQTLAAERPEGFLLAEEVGDKWFFKKFLVKTDEDAAFVDRIRFRNLGILEEKYAGLDYQLVMYCEQGRCS
jgi:hypothetical protein